MNGSRTEAASYHPWQIACHWIIAAVIVAVVVLGLIAADTDAGPEKDDLLDIHKSFGLGVLVLTLLRAGMRAALRHPAYPAAMSVSHQLAASANHVVLYVLTLGMPVSGYISVAARGRSTTFFGLFDVPRWAPLSREWSRLSETIHATSQYVLYAAVALHVMAALYHHFIARDRILARMIPAID